MESLERRNMGVPSGVLGVNMVLEWGGTGVD